MMISYKGQWHKKSEGVSAYIRTNNDRKPSTAITLKDNRPNNINQMKLISHIHETKHVGCGPNSVVQRLTGMEIELDVPFYGKANFREGVLNPQKGTSLSADDQQLILNFLEGGGEYGRVYGQGEHYDVSADHGGFVYKHADFIESLIKGRFIKATNIKPKSMAKIEYRTDPFDENDNEAMGIFQETRKKIQAHAARSVDLAYSGESGPVEVPVYGMFTGIPVKALRTLILGNEILNKKLNSLLTKPERLTYYQTTTGVLPSEIPGLFMKAEEDMLSFEGRSNIKDLNQICAIHLKKSVELANMFVESPLLGKFTYLEKKSVIGWLTLIAEYLLGYTLELTQLRYNDEGKKDDVTEKNLLPYLSRTPIGETIKALPKSVIASIYGSDKGLWIELLNKMVHNAGSSNIMREVGLFKYNAVHEDMFGRMICPEQWIKNMLESYQPSGIDLASIRNVYKDKRIQLSNSTKNEDKILRNIYSYAVQLADVSACNSMRQNIFGKRDGRDISEIKLLRGWLALVAFNLFIKRLVTIMSALSSRGVVNGQFGTMVCSLKDKGVLTAINEIPFWCRPNARRMREGESVWPSFMCEFQSSSESFNILSEVNTDLKLPIYSRFEQEWLSKTLLAPVLTESIGADNMMGLDDQTHREVPILNFNDEQAIPLEDRRTTIKTRFSKSLGNNEIENVLDVDWALACDRRKASTQIRLDLRTLWGKMKRLVWKLEIENTIQELDKIDLNAVDAIKEYSKLEGLKFPLMVEIRHLVVSDLIDGKKGKLQGVAPDDLDKLESPLFSLDYVLDKIEGYISFKEKIDKPTSQNENVSLVQSGPNSTDKLKVLPWGVPRCFIYPFPNPIIGKKLVLESEEPVSGAKKSVLIGKKSVLGGKKPVIVKPTLPVLQNPVDAIIT